MVLYIILCTEWAGCQAYPSPEVSGQGHPQCGKLRKTLHAISVVSLHCFTADCKSLATLNY